MRLEMGNDLGALAAYWSALGESRVRDVSGASTRGR